MPAQSTVYRFRFSCARRFGVRGANLPALLRALVACGWFGIQTWIGGQAIASLFGIVTRVVWPQVADPAAYPETIWVCFFSFWLLNMFVIWKGINTIRLLEGVAAPLKLAVGVLLFWWITRKAGGLGPVFGTPAKFRDNAAFFRFSIPSLTGMVGFWSTVALNIPDFTRCAVNQRAQALGPTLGLPAAMTVYSFIGVAVTSASAVLFGAPSWDPVALIGRFNEPVVALIALIAIRIATLNTNVAANVVSPSNDFSNLNPRLISFRTGGLITGVIGVRLMPWKLMGDYGSCITGWLVGYSGLLGPVAGVIADHFIVRRRVLRLDELYVRGGACEYSSGINARAIWSLAAGIFVALIGLVVPSLGWLYSYAWFVGFAVSASVYILPMKGKGETHAG